mgnify:CR=1 FL=1
MSQQQKLEAIRAQLELAEQQRKALATASALDRAAIDAHIALLSAAYAKACLR